MILPLELFGAYLAGAVSVIVAAVLLGPRLMRYHLKRKLGGMIDLTSKP